MKNTTNGTAAIEVTGLCRTFRGRVALDEINLSIPRGSVFGLVGVNGAGKTTLIRHLIGALKPQRGLVRILGQDPISQRTDLMRRVGYMSEEDGLPRWAKVGELIDFFRGIQPHWDSAYASELCDLFELSRGDSMSGLSKGQRARLGLLVAIAHRPEVLILDEPSSGLDPIARGDILEAVIRTVNEDGRTVLFSSHLLDEVDRVCDSVAMIHDGRVLETATLESLQANYCELVVGIESAESLKASLTESFGWQLRGGEWSAVVRQDVMVDDLTADAQVRSLCLARWFEAVATRARSIDSQNRDVAAEVEHV
ncbi:MAG: ABC transporter ATP-binding protein [Planctomycetota bacterium]